MEAERKKICLMRDEIACKNAKLDSLKQTVAAKDTDLAALNEKLDVAKGVSWHI